jgi:flotillin
VAEVEAEIISELARILAEIPVQQERIKQVEQQLEADVIAPAEAQTKKAIAKAKGDAAPIIEDGRAMAEGTRKLAESWLSAGNSARDIFLLQKLETILKTLAGTVPVVTVENVTVMNAENGNFATKAAALLEQFKQTTGIDLGRTLNKE